MDQHILAGDIGGTKTKLAIFLLDANGKRITAERTYASQNFPSFSEIVADFRTHHSIPIASACLGVAGPVTNGRCITTNLPWEIDETSLLTQLSVPHAKLLNDLEAMAIGMLGLPAEDFVEINPKGLSTDGNRAVIAAGTGCGEAILYWDGDNHHAIATEGGHGDFAPNNAEQDALLQYLRNRFEGHVSYERLLSGPGLVNIYDFLRDREPSRESLEVRTLMGSATDPGRLIGEKGTQGQDRLCADALDLFVQVYGAEAGNLALRSFAKGGVYIGGGIAPKTLQTLTSGQFLESFCDKGRFAPFMRTLSIKVALNPNVGLLGAADKAHQLSTL